MHHCADAMGSLKGFYLPYGIKKTYDAYHNRPCEFTENLCGVSHLLYNYYYSFFICILLRNTIVFASNISYYVAVYCNFLRIPSLFYVSSFCFWQKRFPPKTRQPLIYSRMLLNSKWPDSQSLFRFNSSFCIGFYGKRSSRSVENGSEVVAQ